MIEWSEKSRHILFTGDCLPALFQAHLYAIQQFLLNPSTALSSHIDWSRHGEMLLNVGTICGLIASTAAGAAHIWQCDVGCTKSLNFAFRPESRLSHTFAVKTVYDLILAFTFQLLLETESVVATPEVFQVIAENLVCLRQLGFQDHFEYVKVLCDVHSHLSINPNAEVLQRGIVDCLANLMHTTSGASKVLRSTLPNVVLSWMALRFRDGLQV